MDHLAPKETQNAQQSLQPQTNQESGSSDSMDMYTSPEESNTGIYMVPCLYYDATNYLPYIYYEPSNGYYALSDYSPYIPGAAMGFFIPCIGADQYMTNLTCQTQVSTMATTLEGHEPVLSGAHAPMATIADSIQSDAAGLYNRDDLQVDYPIAKFYVIKSYSENNLYNSIKHSVWSSTENGQKKLQNAYKDAQNLSVGLPIKCPVFLFFSVNGSKHFCGIAEMIGPVDFDKDMDFWEKDQWSGSFPVKWHMIKDVANTELQHICLGKDRKRPVTESRNTQQVPYLSGIDMISIFKRTPMKSSILVDKFYEEGKKIWRNRKARLFAEGSQSGEAPKCTLKNSLDSKGKQQCTALNQPPKADENLLIGADRHISLEDLDMMISIASKLITKTDRAWNNLKSSVAPTGQTSNSDRYGIRLNPKHADGKNPKYPETMASTGPGNVQVVQQLSTKNAELGHSVPGGEVVTDIIIVGSIPIKVQREAVTDVIIVGSIPIKVKRPLKSSCSTITVGSIPVKLKDLQDEKKWVFGSSHPQRK